MCTHCDVHTLQSAHTSDTFSPVTEVEVPAVRGPTAERGAVPRFRCSSLNLQLARHGYETRLLLPSRASSQYIPRKNRCVSTRFAPQTSACSNFCPDLPPPITFTALSTAVLGGAELRSAIPPAPKGAPAEPPSPGCPGTEGAASAPTRRRGPGMVPAAPQEGQGCPCRGRDAAGRDAAPQGVGARLGCQAVQKHQVPPSALRNAAL